MTPEAAPRPYCFIEDRKDASSGTGESRPYYAVFLLEGSGKFSVDFTAYTFSGPAALFTTPWQRIQLHLPREVPFRVLWFHGDFYCIEYHRREVACNGLLFNNIYQNPAVPLAPNEFGEFGDLFDRIKEELGFTDPYSEAVSRTCLQLLLALGSRAKMKVLSPDEALHGLQPVMKFRDLLEQHYLSERSPSFYADLLGMSANTFSKKCRVYFRKSPSVLIQERVILEAKRLIHLSFKSMKEVAAILNFEDEHYFSRYFKKHTGMAPTAFRESVGVSVVAHLSRD